MPHSKVRVMLVDDHPLFRQGLRRLLESEERFEVVAEASCGYQAVYQAHLQQPRLALIDVQLPGITGLQVARMLMRQHPSMRIVIVSTQFSEEWLIDALRVGAAAFLLKDARPEEIIATIDRVLTGQEALSGLVLSRPDLTSQLLRELRQLGTVDGAAIPVDQLTPRELEVLDCVAQGMSNKEIADTLFITEQTVKNHMTSVLRKLEAEDRVQVILKAVRCGWVVVAPGDAAVTAN
jgi:DNA-binding NarL/FixJ family response regulator